MEALSTRFPFVFVRVHSFLSPRNRTVAAIVYWAMIKINFHNKISRNEAKNKAIYNEIQWPIVLCRTVTRTYCQRALWAILLYLILYMKRSAIKYTLFTYSMVWCFNGVRIALNSLLLLMFFYYAAGVGVLFWLLLLIASIYCV